MAGPEDRGAPAPHAHAGRRVACVPDEVKKLVARARALTDLPYPGFWTDALEAYYVAHTDDELKGVIAACDAERERRGRPPVRSPRRGSRDEVEILARHALDVSFVLAYRRERPRRFPRGFPPREAARAAGPPESPPLRGGIPRTSPVAPERESLRRAFVVALGVGAALLLRRAIRGRFRPRLRRKLGA